MYINLSSKSSNVYERLISITVLGGSLFSTFWEAVSDICASVIFFLLEVKFIEEVSCGCAFFHH